MEEMKTMLENEENEFGDSIEYEYLIPTIAIKEYLETSENKVVDKFLEEEYTSEDTSNIIDLCIRKGLNFEVVRDELVGHWK